MRSRMSFASLRPLLAAVAFTLFATAWAQTLAVYPFDSQETLLGVAVADEIAAAFASGAVVLGPEVTPGAIPPLVVEGGFLSVGRLAGPLAMTGPAGADLVRTSTGVDVAATGRLEVLDDALALRLFVASADGSRQVTLRADVGRPDRLVALAVRVLEGDLGLRVGSMPVPAAPWDAEGAYGEYARGVALIGAGLVPEGGDALEQAVAGAGAPPRASEMLADVRAVLAGDATLAGGDAGDEHGTEAGRRATRRALLSVGTVTLDEPLAFAAFEQMRAATTGVLADLWLGVLAANVNDRVGAMAVFDEAAAVSSYARTVRASFLLSRGDDQAATDDLDAVTALGPAAGSAALLGASLVANVASDPTRERAALEALSVASPYLAYAFERLSYLAFDRDDAQAAAEALAVAVELEPESDLYWTNLGWAYYLLGFVDDSEAASLRALDLDGSQYIAAYNLGLARAVTGRLAEAMRAYEQAMRFDGGIDDEAVHDLENARLLYPGVAPVEFALATLYEAEGRRSDAAGAYQRFLRLARADEAAFGDDLDVARERFDALSAPPPPLEILGGVRVTLGVRGVDASPYHPGDPIYPSFELSTPGDALPARVLARVSLWTDAAAADALLVVEREVALPSGAVGFVVDDIELALPEDLAAGTYLLRVGADAGEGQQVAAETVVEVAGSAQALRRLIGRGVVLTGLQSGAPLYGRADLADPDVAVLRLVQELRATADAAEGALPAIEGGRFAGMSGGEAFRASEPDAVRDFLAYLAASDIQSGRFTFVDAYAQWLLDGTPAAR